MGEATENRSHKGMCHKNNCRPAYLRCLLLLTSEQQKMQEVPFFLPFFFKQRARHWQFPI